MQASPTAQSAVVGHSWPCNDSRGAAASGTFVMVVPPSLPPFGGTTTLPSGVTMTPPSATVVPFGKQVFAMQTRSLAQSDVRVHDSPSALVARAGELLLLLQPPSDAAAA